MSSSSHNALYWSLVKSPTQNPLSNGSKDPGRQRTHQSSTDGEPIRSDSEKQAGVLLDKVRKKLLCRYANQSELSSQSTENVALEQ